LHFLDVLVVRDPVAVGVRRQSDVKVVTYAEAKTETLSPTNPKALNVTS
jgi:hypothetical protein